MKLSAAFGVGLAASALLAATPVQAQACWGPAAIKAAKLRSLDTMLSVTAARCAGSPADFRADYAAFAAARRGDLDDAGAVLGRQLAGDTGALDRMTAATAESFAGGHPRMDCRQLRVVTRDLAISRVPNALADAADVLVGPLAIPGRVCGFRVASVH